MVADGADESGFMQWESVVMWSSTQVERWKLGLLLSCTLRRIRSERCVREIFFLVSEIII